MKVSKILISKHEYDLLNYYGMAFVKVCNILSSFHILPSGWC